MSRAISRAFLIAMLMTQPATTHAADGVRVGDRLLGVWGSEVRFEPQVSGPLTIDGRARPWIASIGGYELPVTHEGDLIGLTIPGEGGQFRGSVRQKGKSIEGFWIQPSGKTLSAAYATPVTLSQGGKGVWHGVVNPLADQLSQYLWIQRDENGALFAFLRNPEMNIGRGLRYDVEIDGDAIALSIPQRSGWTLRGSFDEETDELRINWQGIGIFAFTRRSSEQALGLYPRTPANAAYHYRQPIVIGDGWKTSSLHKAQLDETRVAALIEHIEKAALDGSAAPQIHSLLVARGGKLVLEEYFLGHARERTHDSRSAGKTFAPLLVGLAMEHGRPFSTDDTVLPMFPQYDVLQHIDARKKAITIADLMSMTSGLACDDNEDDSPGGEDRMQSQNQQPDWYRFTLDLPMTGDPGGTHATYCSASINLLGGVVRHATGSPLLRFFDRHVARPLQFSEYHINLMPDGDVYLGGGIRLRSRDMLKLGQLYLDGGVWNGRRVVSRDWVEQSLKVRSEFGDNHGYGYAWHTHSLKAGERSWREYAAEGNGGQFVMVVPELQLVVGINAGNYGDFRTWSGFQNFVTEYIIPAIVDQ